METIIGRIENKEEAVAKNGSKYLIFTIGGKKYTSFNEELAKFNVGETIKAGLERAGKFKNLVSMSHVTEKVAQNASMGQIGATEGISKIEHSFESEYEFGPSGNRHKIKYRTIEELKKKLKELESAGLLTDSLSF